MDASDTLALINAVRGGDDRAADVLFSRVYGDLRRIAQRRISSQRGPVTLSATGLVHEAYVRMVDLERVDWQDRGHFFAMASRTTGSARARFLWL